MNYLEQWKQMATKPGDYIQSQKGKYSIPATLAVLFLSGIFAYIGVTFNQFSNNAFALNQLFGINDKFVFGAIYVLTTFLFGLLNPAIIHVVATALGGKGKFWDSASLYSQVIIWASFFTLRIYAIPCLGILFTLLAGLFCFFVIYWVYCIAKFNYGLERNKALIASGSVYLVAIILTVILFAFMFQSMMANMAVSVSSAPNQPGARIMSLYGGRVELPLSVGWETRSDFPYVSLPNYIWLSNQATSEALNLVFSPGFSTDVCSSPPEISGKNLEACFTSGSGFVVHSIVGKCADMPFMATYYGANRSAAKGILEGMKCSEQK